METTSGVPITTKNLAKFANHIDPHLMLVLINDAIENKAFSEKSLLNQKFKILKNTYLIHEARRVGELLGDNSQLDKLQETIDERGKQLSQSLATALKLESEENLTQTILERDFDVIDFADEDKKLIFDYAKFQYESGNYKDCETILMKFVKISKGLLYLNWLWGLLNCFILNSKFENVENTINEISEAIFNNKSIDVDKHEARSMLLSTALFVCGHMGSSTSFMFKLLSRYCEQWSNSSVFLLRYFIAFAIIGNETETISSQILPLICQSPGYLKTQASHVDVSKYKDSFTMFIESVIENFDFEQAIQFIPEIGRTCDEDYFLRNHKQDVIENAKTLIMSFFTNIYTQEDMADIAHKLGLDVAITGSA